MEFALWRRDLYQSQSCSLKYAQLMVSKSCCSSKRVSRHQDSGRVVAVMNRHLLREFFTHNIAIFGTL